jgi:hypothetical protein
MEFLTGLLEDLEKTRGFHEREAIRRLRDRMTRTQECVMADAALEPENWGGA